MMSRVANRTRFRASVRQASAARLLLVPPAHLAQCGAKCYVFVMRGAAAESLPAELVSDLEKRFFWWEPVGSRPRSPARILAQAMNLAPFDLVLRLEEELGTDRLVEAMLGAEPGWFDDRSWEFWRGRLVHATGRAIPADPPRRSFDARSL